MALMVCLLPTQAVANFSSLWLWVCYPGFFAGWSGAVLPSLSNVFHVLIFKSATETQSWVHVIAFEAWPSFCLLLMGHVSALTPLVHSRILSQSFRPTYPKSPCEGP